MGFCVLRKSKETRVGLDFKKGIVIFLFLCSVKAQGQELTVTGGRNLLFSNLKLSISNDSSINNTTQAAVFQVWISLSEVCMISRYYAKELSQKKEAWAKLGISLSGFFPNAFSTDSGIRAFSKINHLNYPLFRDSLALFSRSAGVIKTPEVLVCDLTGKIWYQGRIDDFYVAIGRHKTKVSQSFLLNALRNLQNGKKPEKAYVEPVGCLIDFSLWTR